MGFAVYDVRAQGLAASGGATDFGEYFTYFSTSLSSLHSCWQGCSSSLASSSVCRKSGCFRRSGSIRRRFGACSWARRFSSRGIGGVVGIAGAIAYSALIMLGLRTWWVDAVGTTALTLHVDPISLVAGALSVVAIAVASIWWSLRALATASTRSLLAGTKSGREGFSAVAAKTPPDPCSRAPPPVCSPRRCSSARHSEACHALPASSAPAHFHLSRCCVSRRVWLRRGRWGGLHGNGMWAVWRLGWRNTAYRPARSVLCIALIAFATFVIVAVEAFKRDEPGALVDRHSGGGGYPLLVETLLPIVHDLNDVAGREAMNLPAGGALQGVQLRSVSRAPGRRHELPESVSAEEPAHHWRNAGVHQQRAIRVPQFAGRVGRRTRESVAVAESRARGRGYSGHHRRQLDDVRSAHEAWRRLRPPGVVRAPHQTAARRGVGRQYFPGGDADGRAAVRAAVSGVGRLSLFPRRRAPRANTRGYRIVGITIVRLGG